MNKSDFNFDAYSFSKQPDYNEAAVRQAFSKAAPLKTVVDYAVCCKRGCATVAVVHNNNVLDSEQVLSYGY